MAGVGSDLGAKGLSLSRNEGRQGQQGRQSWKVSHFCLFREFFRPPVLPVLPVLKERIVLITKGAFTMKSYEVLVIPPKTHATEHPAPEILTAAEVARELRCSKAHVSKAIAGKLPHVTALPAISLGRRKLVRRSALFRWLDANEQAMISPSPETTTWTREEMK